MDSPVLPHDQQAHANKRNSGYAYAPQIRWRLLAPATLHLQVGGRVGSVFVPLHPAPPIPPCVECEMLLGSQDAQQSVSKKQQQPEEERGHQHPILSRNGPC